jgi:hypothetical protein
LSVFVSQSLVSQICPKIKQTTYFRKQETLFSKNKFDIRNQRIWLGRPVCEIISFIWVWWSCTRSESAQSWWPVHCNLGVTITSLVRDLPGAAEIQLIHYTHTVHAKARSDLMMRKSLAPHSHVDSELSLLLLTQFVRSVFVVDTSRNSYTTMTIF